jgi:glyoxylase-like metal-dependent hydrolase (beta-lactamase superfamily II)
VTLPAQLHRLAPWLFVWQAFDPTIKTDLFSTALSGSEGTSLIDPIAGVAPQVELLHKTKPVRAIVITNENHWRDAAALSQRLAAPIFAHTDAALAEQKAEFSPVNGGDHLGTGLLAIEIPGAAAGEIALFSPANKGTLIVGDALINFEPHGFALLPAKYCADQKAMRKSLGGLLDHPFERILFAHGFPILSGGSGRLRSLLEQK